MVRFMVRMYDKGRLPYHLRTESTITRLEAPHALEADVTGELAGHGAWTSPGRSAAPTSASTGA